MTCRFAWIKCKLTFFSHDTVHAYTMKVQGKVWELEETTEERDLGIIFTSNSKPSRQCVI